MFRIPGNPKKSSNLKKSANTQINLVGFGGNKIRTAREPGEKSLEQSDYDVHRKENCFVFLRRA